MLNMEAAHLLLAVCVLSVANCLPALPKVFAIRAEEYTSNQGGSAVGTKVFEYYNEELVSPEQCEGLCTFTYPSHTYPVVEHHLACRQGCILGQLGTNTDSCEHECSRMYSTQEERYACGVGCTSPVVQTGDGSHDKFLNTLVSVSSVKISNFGLFNLKEQFKKWIWGGSSENKIQWEQQEHVQLPDGQEMLLLSGHASHKEAKDILPLELASNMFEGTPTIVYVSRSILRTVYYGSSTNKLLFYIGLVLLIVGVPMLVISFLTDCRGLSNKGNKEEEEIKLELTIDSTVLEPCCSYNDTPKPDFQPVAIFIKNSKN